MRILLALLLTLPAFTQDLSATLSHTVREVTADGFIRVTTSKEHFQRAGQHLWRLRLLPEGRPKSEHEGHGREIDLALAGQHLFRGTDGAVGLEYLRPDLRTLVEVAPREWEEAGYDGSWAEAFHLMDPAHLKALSSRPGPKAGTRWFEQKGSGGELRVLWSDPLKLALRIERRSADGSRSSLTEVRVAKASAERPWTQTAGWTRKDYTDLMD